MPSSDVATGWVVGSADTVITAAHLLFKHAARGADAEVINPDRCVFVLFDADQRVRQIVRIRYGLSPWRNQHQRDDSSFDVAVLKLERPARVDHVPAVKISNAMAERSVSAFDREYHFPHMIVFADRNKVEREETFELASAARDRCRRSTSTNRSR